MANGSTMVLPPNAAERVPEAKSSAMTMPGPDGWAMMDVAVDAAGQHQQAARIDDVGRIAEIFAERRDPPAADADVAVRTCRTRLRPCRRG